jgi:hypothetical protein
MFVSLDDTIREVTLDKQPSASAALPPVALIPIGRLGPKNGGPSVSVASSLESSNLRVLLDRTLREPGPWSEILNPLELGAMPDGVVALARSGAYRDDFRQAFGADPVLDDVARALATYVRTIVAGDSPYDRFAAGNGSALSESARRGLTLFAGRAGCTACHSGPTFTHEQFHNTGVAWRRGTPSDIGRAAVTGADEDRGAFKTPTLREVARTAPYMHDGSIKTLGAVIDYYDRGAQRNPGLDHRLRRPRPRHWAGRPGNWCSRTARLAFSAPRNAGTAWRPWPSPGCSNGLRTSSRA